MTFLPVARTGPASPLSALALSQWVAPVKMAAPLWRPAWQGLQAFSGKLDRISWILCSRQGFQTTATCHKNRAARVRVGKGDKPVTYEQAHPPHYIAHRKGWLSQHTSNLDGESGAAERTVEDVFIRKFIYGTFHGCLANEIVLKRRANTLIICAIFVQKLPPSKFYFLIGYTEVLLSFLYKCPVKMEVQTVPNKVVYKYL